MKKFFALITGLVLLTVSAFAATNELIVQNSEAGGLSFSGTGFGKNIPVKVEVLKKGNGESKLCLINGSNAESYILYTDVLYTDEDGDFSLTVPTDEKAVYFYHISSLNGFFGSGYAKAYSETEYESAVLEFIGKDENARTITEAEKLFADFCMEYRLNHDILNTFSQEQRDDILNSILSTKAATAADFSKEISLLAAVTKLNNAADAASVKSLISENYDVLGLEKTFFYEDYLSLAKTGENEIDATVNVCGRMLDTELTKENFEEIFKKNILIELIRQGLWNEISGFLSDYSSIVSVDMSEFSKASSEIQKQTQVKFKNATVNDISVSTWPTVFQSCYEKAVSEAGSGSGSGGSGSSGSGSSGSGGSKNSSLGSAPVYISPGNIASTGNKTFTDTTDVPWAEEAIDYLTKKGIISGRGNNLFCPNESVKREEIVKMIVEALDVELENDLTDAKFADVPVDSWYYPYVCTAVNSGVINGLSETVFGTGVNVTRQDIAVMLYRAFGAKLKEYGGAGNTFSDNAEIAPYGLEAINALSEAEIVKGSDNKFLPINATTRAEAAVMLYRLLNL